MKKIQFLLSFALTALIITSTQGQNELAMVELSNEDAINRTATPVASVIDNKAFEQIAGYVKSNATHPFSSLAFANEIEVKMQISLNAEGKVIDSRVVSATDKVFAKEIKQLIDDMPNVSPIKVNGKSTAQTIQIPLIFK